MNAAVALSAQGVSVVFGGVTAVKDVSLDVREGEVLALVGPNGSGKTSLLNAYSGFVAIAAGTVMLMGEAVTGQPAHRRFRRGLGRTFQNPKPVGLASVIDLMQFGWYLHDRRTFARAVFRPFWTQRAGREVRAAAAAQLERVGLPGRLLDRELRSLSHGQLKMADLARALIGRPRVLLLDEPTSGLNDEEIERSRNLILESRRDGMTLLVVEHNVQFVLDLADHLAVLDRGALLASGEPRETLRRRDVAEAYLGPAATKRHGLSQSSEGASSESRS